MRDYKDTVLERYDYERWDGKSIIQNQYSMINPVGRYGLYHQLNILSDFLKLALEKTNKELDSLKILDVGCGSGVMTREVLELVGSSPQNIYGIDYSRSSIEHCKSMNPAINYA